MLNHFSPRLVVFVGGGIFSAGILLSAFMMFPSPMPMYITYGLMQGFGQGMVYTSIVSAALKWFPERIGFASGVVVTANGLCGFFLTPLSRMILQRYGVREAFLTVGILAAVSWILASLFVGNPPEMAGYVPAPSEAAVHLSRGYSSDEMMCTRKFYLLLLTMLFGLLSYFFLSPIAQTLQVERGISPAAAAGAVMMGSVVNASVRLFLPTLADRVGRVVCVEGVLAVCAAAMILLMYEAPFLTMAATIAMYGCYGGIMGSFPSLTGSIFGLEHVGENYGYVMIGMVIAALGAPVVTNYVLKTGGSQEMIFLIGAVCAAAALGCLVLLSKELKHTAQGYQKA